MFYFLYVYIKGGEIYINCESDGLDVNENISISGGNLKIYEWKKVVMEILLV